jgi:predicted ATPase
VELSALDGGEHVVAAVARALDVVLDSDRPGHAIRSMAELDVLLVLDNCEHVIDDVTSLMDQLIGVGGARATVLATSQVRLGLSSEQVVSVHPLSSQHAFELFALRAAAIRPLLDLGDIGRDRVVTMLAGLDQLPLTIEMAAARLGSMTFDELERAIVGGMPTPVTHRSPVRRHRSLDSLVTWSAELLDASLRRTFTEFAVFAGSVTATDAAAVVGVGSDKPTVIFQLAALADRSLLDADVAGSTTQYRMLTTVRAVASRWLDDSGTANEVRRRHAEHFSAAAVMIDRQIRTPAEADGRQRLDAIAAELRAAHRWAREYQPQLAAEMSGALHLAAYSTFWNEPAEWSRVLLAQHPDVDTGTLLGAQLVVAGADANRSQLVAAQVAATALSTAEDPRVRAAALEILADVAIYDGHLPDVAAITAEMRRLGEELEDSHAVAMAGVDEALALAFDDDADGALVILRRLDLETLSPSDRAWVIYARGEALSTAGDPTAVSAYTAAIDMAQGIGNPFVASVARASLAAEHARAGDMTDAFDQYAICLQEYARHGNYVHAVTTLRNLIEVLVAAGDDRGATILAGATSGDHLRHSYGVETTRLSTLLAAVELRVGATDFAIWTGEGLALDVPQAVQVAVDLVEGHRS